MLDWFDGVFDPDVVNLKKTNAWLNKVFTSKAALALSVKP
jgi:hypothetical protein